MLPTNTVQPPNHSLVRSTHYRRGLDSRMALLVIVTLLCSLLPVGTPLPAPGSVAHAQAAGDMFGRVWSSAESASAWGMAWGDYDGDGDLDLAVAYATPNQPISRVYRNDDGVLTSAWTPAQVQDGAPVAWGTAVAWGDYDQDGDLDLAVASGNPLDKTARPFSNRLYRNDNGTLTTHSVWASEPNNVAHSANASSLVWADIDGDGYLDMVVGYRYSANRVYRNVAGTGGERTFTLFWSSGTTGPTQSIAVGDIDNDGDIDLIGGNGQPLGDWWPSTHTLRNFVYLNNGGTLTQWAAWSFPVMDRTFALDLGDFDNDGDLDLLVGNVDEPIRVYRNLRAQGQTSVESLFDMQAPWIAPETDGGFGVAWGDYDGDGDLDILVGNNSSTKRVYQNNGGNWSSTLWTSVWVSNDADFTRAVEWADVDNDGALDFAAVSENQPTRVYFNNMGRTLERVQSWEGPTANRGEAVALGDYDNDGDLDLAVGNGSEVELYTNTAGTFSLDQSFDSFMIADLDWGDVDGDSDLDLLAVSPDGFNFLYPNINGILSTDNVQYLIDTSASACGADWGDYDGDGDLDVAVANGANTSTEELGFGHFDQPNTIYRNDNGVLTHNPIWRSPESEKSCGIAWGDMDGDGDLDLAVGNYGQPSRVYRNDGVDAQNVPLLTSVWQPTDSLKTTSLAWGDYDGDGDLDLAVGNAWEPNRLYRNDDGRLTTTAVWSSQVGENTQDVAWGDADNDGDLDLLVGNMGFGSQPSRIYRNDHGVLTDIAMWSDGGATPGGTNSVAWGDIDNDGDLDMVEGNGDWLRTGDQSNRLFRNQRNDVTPSSDAIGVRVVQPGDLPAASSSYAHETIVTSEAGIIGIPFTLWKRGEAEVRQIHGFYSLNGGGAWQPAMTPNGTNVMTGLTLPSAPVWQTSTAQAIPDNGTVSSQGTLGGSGTVQDLTVELLLTHPRSRQLAAELWAPWPNAQGTTVTLFDNLLTDGTNPAAVTFSDAASQPIPTQVVQATNTYNSTDIPKTISSSGRPTVQSTLSVANGGTIMDVDVVSLRGNHNRLSDLRFTLRGPDGTQVTFLSPACATSVNFTFTLDDESSTAFPSSCSSSMNNTYRPTSALTVFDGKQSTGTWTLTVQDTRDRNGGSLSGWGLRIATQTTTRALNFGAYKPDNGTLAAFNGAPLTTPFTLRVRDKATGETGTLQSWKLTAALPPASASYTYQWDTFASGFFGQADNVVFRLEVLPEMRPARGESGGSYQYGYSAAQTAPFRARGTQVRVVDAQGNGMANALVYRLPAGQEQGGEALASPAAEPFVTNSEGYLEGRDELRLGDRLLALAPVYITDTYTLYHTNGVPVELGVDVPSVQTPGVQTLAVSPNTPLILFDLTVALEWDASRNPAYLQQLTFNLQRASQHLYDFTNGQMALGNVTVTQNADEWGYAEVVIRAANDQRPYAHQGGIVLTPTVDPDWPEVVYDAGQVTMGSTWNRYGNPGESLGEDWPVVLAHELGHYLLHLDDVYLGLDANGLLRTVNTCTGSAMGDPYTDPHNTEFIADDAHWAANCGTTLAQQTLGRDEWATIQLWYPTLQAPTTMNAGPRILPFHLTSVQVEDPVTPTNVLEDPTFYLDYAGNSVASSQAQVYLLRDVAGAGESDFVLPLGGPLGGQNRITAHGAQPGDRLCVFDPQQQQYGCEVIELGDDRLALEADATWQPVIQLSPVTSTTFGLDVDNLPAGLVLRARLYPELGSAYPAISLSREGNRYSGVFQLAQPELAGHVQVWVAEAASELNPRREALVAYSIGGNPGRRRQNRTDLRGGGGRRRQNRAPVVSPDGQMTFYTPTPLPFAEGAFYTIQSMAGLPNVPAGRTPIGQGYNLMTTAGAPALTGSISFEYLTQDVLMARVEEEDLKIYHWDGVKWTMLPTVVDEQYNFASAPSAGAGIYALMAGVEVGLYTPGWNMIGYPIRGTQLVTEALRSIDGAYSQVFGFEPDGISDPWSSYLNGGEDTPWRRYDVTLPAWANTLTHLEFGRGYWLNITATEAITLYLRNNNPSLSTVDGEPELEQMTLPPPPAIFYGRVLSSTDFLPAPGMEVIARVGGAVCGRTTMQSVDGQVVYVVDVLAVDTGASAGCGAPGSMVTFEVGGRELGTTARWDNMRSHNLLLQLAPAAELRLYLPLVTR